MVNGYLEYFPTFLHSQWFVTPPYPDDSWAGKTVVVTGSNAGLGLEAARHFARLGAAKLILAARRMDSAAEAKASIEQSTGCAPDVIECWELDLCSYESVKAFAARCATLPRLDCLLENAAVATHKFRMAEDNESTITTNVVSTFLLALLVLPKLKETAAAFKTRPVLTFVASEVHYFTTLKGERRAVDKGKYAGIFETLADEKVARMFERYNVSKLIEVLAFRELTSTLAPVGYPITINCMNPGLCHSTLTREFAIISGIFKILMGARTTEVGSRTLVHAAGAGEETHGEYLSDCGIAPTASFVRSQEGKELQVRVWKELSEKLEAIQPAILSKI